MGQIIIPTDNKIIGPWLLDNKALEELNETITIIESKLVEAYNSVVEKTAEEEFEKYRRWDENIDMEGAKEKAKNTYPLSKSDSYVLIVTKQGKKIKENNILELLKGSQINDFHPTELRVLIEKGPFEFVLEISTKYNGALETRIKTFDDTLFNDINYEISKWTDKHKPNIIMQKWSNWFPSFTIPIAFFLIMVSFFFKENKTEIYENQLSIESNELLKDGLSTQQKQKRALEIILQKETGYVPVDFNPKLESNKIFTDILLYGSIMLIVLSISPKTVIGLGKNKWKINFYRKWSYIVLVYIPMSVIIPLIKSKLL